MKVSPSVGCIVIAASACAAVPSLQNNNLPFPIQYSVRDEPANKRITLTYINSTMSDICLSSTNWPDSYGRIESASGDAYVQVDGERFFIKDFEGGYCPGCALRVKPNSEIRASIPYDAFAIPLSLAGRQKSFSFAMFGTNCKGVRSTH